MTTLPKTPKVDTGKSNPVPLPKPSAAEIMKQRSNLRPAQIGQQSWSHPTLAHPEQYSHPQFMEYQRQMTNNPTFQRLIGEGRWQQNKPQTIALRQLGYLPTAWEDPRTVVKYHNFLKVAPKGWTPPDWLDPVALEEAYKWFAFRNGNTTPDKWKFLPADDPARDWLQGLNQPPANLHMPTDSWYAKIPTDIVPTGTQPTTPAAPGSTNPVIDWSKVPGWQKIAYYAASNPATAPLAQGLAMAGGSLLMGNIPGVLGAVGITISQYAAQSNIPIIKDVGNVINSALMWGMQQAEAGLGFSEQLGYDQDITTAERWIPVYGQLYAFIRKTDPEKWKAIFKDTKTLKAAWEASKIYYESRGSNPLQNIGPLLQWIYTGGDKEHPGLAGLLANKPEMAQTGQVWVLPEPIYDSNGNLTGWNYHPDPVTVPPGYTLEDARKRVLKGDNPDQVLAEFRQIYGFSGTLTDLVGSIVVNPLVLVPGAEKAGAKGIADVVGKVAEARGDTATATAAGRWYNAAEVSQGGLSSKGGILDSYRTLIRSTVPIDELSAFDRTWLGRKITGLTPEGTIKGMAPAPAKPNILSYIGNLTPDAKARVWHQFVLENWKTIAIQSGMDPVETTRLWSAYANGDMQALRDAGATYLQSPEAYTVLPSAKAFLPEAVDLLTEWQTSQGARDTVVRLSVIMNEKPADVVKMFLDDPKRTLDEVLAKDTPEAKQLLADLQAGKVTPETIADSVKVFEGGKIALDPQEWATKFINHLSDHTGEWLKDFYGLKPDSVFFQSAQLLKSAQSLLLLSLSPSYPINNTVNNVVTRSVSGIGGFLPDWKIKEVMARFGWTGEMAPERFGAGLGAAAEGTDIKGQARPGENAIRDAMTAKNLLTVAKRVISSVNEKVGIFSKISKLVEQSESRQAYAIAASKFYGRMWRQGIGFDKMPPNLELALRNIDPSYPGLIQNAIESGYRFEDVQNALSNGASSRNISTYINDAAEKLHMTPSDVSDMLSTVGVQEYLNSELPKAKTPAQIRQVFNNTDKVFNDYVDRVHSQNLRDYAGNVKQRLQTEGFAAVNDLWTEMFSREMDVKNVSDLAWDKAYAEADANWEYTDLRRQIIGAAAQETQARYRRFYEWQEASMKGVIEALGMDDVTRRAYLTDMISIHQQRAEFFKSKSAEVRKFFNTEFASPEERNTAWYTLLEDQNRRYGELVSAEGVAAQGMDVRLEQWFEKTFGPGSGAGVKSWRAGLRYLLDQRGRMVVAFRDSIKDLPAYERDAAWQKFKPEYFNSFVGEKTLEAEGLARIWKSVTGQETVPAKLKGVMGSQPDEAGTMPKPGVEPLAQAELITPEVAQQVQVANVQAEQIAQSVREVGQQHGIPTADESGKPIPGADTHLLNVIRKYGGPEAKRIASIADATPEMADRAFAEQKRVQDMQATLDQELAAQNAAKATQPPVTEVQPAETEPVQPEPAAPLDPLAQKRADVLDLIQRKPLAEVPEVLREPLRITYQEMMDEISAGRKRTLLEVIKSKGGLNIKDMSDITGEAKAQRNWGPGLFSKDGIPLDNMASQLATEEGFLINMNDPMDMGGTRQLTAMIRDELAGNKQYSTFDELLPAELPDWYKNINVTKNKPQVVKRSLSAILNGADNASVGLAPTAAEIAIKSEAFNRLGQIATEDGTLAQATGFPYDAGKFIDRLNTAAADINNADLQQLQVMNEAVSNLINTAPVDLDPAAYDRWQQVTQAIMNRIDELEQRNVITQAHAQAEQAVAQGEQRAHIAWNKQEVADHFRQAGLPPDQADAMAEMFEGTAKWFQNETGRNMSDFYDLAIEAVKHGTPEDLQALLDKVHKGGVQFQTENYFPSHPQYINSGNSKMLGAWGITDDGKFYSGMGIDHHQLAIREGLAKEGAVDVEKIFVERGRFGTFKDDPKTPFIAAFDTSGKDYEYVTQHWDELTNVLKGTGLDRNPVFYGGERAIKSDPFLELDRITGVHFQADKVYRAAIDFVDSMKAIYTLFDDTNASSAPHEFGHHLRKMLYSVADMTGSPELAADIRTVEEFANVKNGRWTNAAEERFAKGFERYLAEGVAPTPALVRVFENFKTWLLDVYHAITGSKIDVPLNDATRQVFDRMLGADRQPMIAEEPAPVVPIPELNPMGPTGLIVRYTMRDNKVIMGFGATPPESVKTMLRDAGFTSANLLDQHWEAVRNPETEALARNISNNNGKPAPTPHVNPYEPIVRGVEALAQNNQYRIKDGSLVQDPASVIDWHDYTLEELRNLPEGTKVSIKRYGARRGGVRRSEVLVENIILQDQITATPKTWYEVAPEGFRPKYITDSSGDIAIVEGWDNNKPEARFSGNPSEKMQPYKWRIATDEDFQRMIDWNKVKENRRATLQQWLADSNGVAPTTPALHQVGDIVRLQDGTQATITKVRPDATLELDNGRVVSAAAVERVAAQTNMLGDFGMKTGPAEQQTTLFQDGGEIPTLPVGGYDQMAGNFEEARALDEIWGEKVRPILDAMQESALKPERTMIAENLPPTVRTQLDDYMRQVRGQMATANHFTMRWAEGMRDFALLPYNRQYGFDKLLSVGVPYEFWMTRTMVNSAIRFMDRPAWFAAYAKINQFHNTYTNNLPSRLKDKYYIPMPFLPDWAGKGVWINPITQLFPFAQFLQPLQQMQTDQDQKVRNAERVIQQWQQSGKLTADQASAALATHAGNDWERAVTESNIQNASESTNGFDYMATILSPALYLTIPYYLATGNKLTSMSWPSGQLPITRFGAGVKTALKGTSLEWLGNIAGGLAAPENTVRRTLKLSEFGEWGDYYTDRQLVNMAADGTITADQARQTMIERKGPLFDQAVARVRLELMLKTPEMAPLYAAAHGAQFDALLALAPSLFSGGLLPEGEIIVNGDKQEYNKAWDAYNSGNKQAISKFFDEHPEYNARLALYDDPDDRLKNFMISEIWDRYTALGDTYRRQARAVLGPDFSVFLTPKNGVDFPIEKLAAWAQALGGIAPKPAENTLTTPPTPAYDQAAQTGQIPWYPPEVAQVMDTYYQQRNEKFPNWYAIQTGYYSLPASEHNSYLMRFPELRKYWDWKSAYQAKYPSMEQWFSGAVYKNTDTSTWPQVLVQAIIDYAMTGTKLSKGAMKLLDTLWVTAGKPYDSAQSWLDTDIAPSVLNSAMPGMQLPQNNTTP